MMSVSNFGDDDSDENDLIYINANGDNEGGDMRGRSTRDEVDQRRN